MDFGYRPVSLSVESKPLPFSIKRFELYVLGINSRVNSDPGRALAVAVDGSRSWCVATVARWSVKECDARAEGNSDIEINHEGGEQGDRNVMGRGMTGGTRPRARKYAAPRSTRNRFRSAIGSSHKRFGGEHRMKKVLYVAFLALAVLALVAPPAMAQEDKPFKVHGEVRFRGEYNSNVTDFDDNGNDNVDFWPYRVRVAVEGSFAHNVAAYVEIQNADFAGGNGFSLLNNNGGPFRSGSGNDGAFGNGSNVELYQGNITFNQLWSKNFNLRLGRQEIVAGNELLLGDMDFYNGISHDGAVGMWNLKKVNLMLWFTRPLETNAINFFGSSSPDQQAFNGANGTQNFWGGYATWTWKKDQNFDVYLMDLDTKVNSN